MLSETVPSWQRVREHEAPSKLAQSGRNICAKNLPRLPVRRRKLVLKPAQALLQARASGYRSHHPAHPRREAPFPTLFCDFLHPLGYLLGRCIRPQFRLHFAHARRQVGIRLAATANARTKHPPTREMAMCATGVVADAGAATGVSAHATEDRCGGFDWPPNS
jgi:hypothetical protein